MDTFLLTYRHRGGQYNVAIPAESWEDAEDRLRAIGTTGRIEGSNVMTIPVNPITLPFAGLLARLIVWWRNLSR